MKSKKILQIAQDAHKKGRLEEAKIYYYKLLKKNSDFALLHILGVVEFQLKNFEIALKFIEKSIKLNPYCEYSHNNCGLILQSLNKLDKALISYDNSININPNFFEAHLNRGNLLNELNRIEEAIISYNNAININPNYAKAFYNLGFTYKKLMRLEESIICFDKAIAIDPNYTTAKIHKSSIELLKGNFQEGYALSENRFKLKSSILCERYFDKPKWSGKESLKNKKILIVSEQGLGDIIQYCRYVPLFKSLGAIVLLEAPKKLIPLLSSLQGVANLIEKEDKLLTYDFYYPLLSLPLAFNTTIKNLPKNIPYLSVPENLKNKWKKYIGNNGFKIGICWQGNKQSELDKGRSFPPSLFKSISKIQNIRLISLQKYEGAEQLANLDNEIKIENLPPDFDEKKNSFLDTAAIMHNLDLIITSDTSLTHLAGALGMKTWLALQYVPDARWLLNVNTSPWYPRHKLFRQKKIGNWDTVFDEIKNELMILISKNY